MTYEDRSQLSEKTLDVKRAIDSIREELEAVDMYYQRADACSDPELKEILLHNAYEEFEHASMLIEWLRRNDVKFEHELKDYLFKQWSIISHHWEH